MTPSLVTTWWAEKLPLGGSESPAGGQLQYGTARYMWRGLWVDGLKAKMRLVENGIEHDIDFIDTSHRRQNEIVLHTTQRGT